MNPRLSVIMSVYNMADSVARGVESILNQTFHDYEFIIIDDGSTDDTLKILHEYENSDSRIRLFSFHSNVGLPRALNYGIKQARSDIIVRMDADDFAFPHRLQTQIDFLNKHPDVGVVGANFVRFYMDTQEEASFVLPETDEEISRALSFRNAMCHPCVAIRKKCFGRYGYYDEKFIRMQDYELWMRWRGRVQFYNIQQPLMRLYSYKQGWEARKRVGRLQILKYDVACRWKNLLSSDHRTLDMLGIFYTLGSRGMEIFANIFLSEHEV